jgi:hypothetical protein
MGLKQLVTRDEAPIANPYNDTVNDLSSSDESEESSRATWSAAHTPSIDPKTPHRSKVWFRAYHLSNAT